MSTPSFLLPRLPLPLPLPYRTPLSRRLLCTSTPPPPTSPPAQPGRLYLVSTPIGHIADLTFRAATILRTASVIAAEDTRRTSLLLSSVPGRRPPAQTLLSCHEHNVRARIPTLLSHLAAGASVALVADAGTPCVSDPGAQLVAAAVGAGVDVVPVPGACAALAALVPSALPLREFSFFGFLPRAGAERKAALDRVRRVDRTVVLYEAPHRLLTTLDALQHLEGDGRPICLAREITKKWEQFLRFDTVRDARRWYQTENVQPRGEFTIVLGPVQTPETNRHDLTAYSDAKVDLAALTKALVAEGVPVSSVARTVAAAADVPKKLVYSFASECKKAMQDHSGGDDT